MKNKKNSSPWKKKKTNPNKFSKPDPDLAFKTHNPWNIGSGFTQQAWSSTKFILKNEIDEKVLIKETSKSKKKNSQQKEW